MSWLDDAQARVEAAFDGVRWWPWQRGVWVTARTDYGRRPHEGEVHEVVVEGACRRVALVRGQGRPLLILPGLYATLDEGLFSRLLGLAAATGRTAALLEDRLGAGTLALNGGEVVGVGRLGLELAQVAAWMGEPPCVVALSAGAAAALAAPPGALHRVAAWSSAADPAVASTRVRGHPVMGPYYGWVHRLAYRRAGLTPPPVSATWDALLAEPMPGPGPTPTLFVHATDDPVAPYAPVEAAAAGPHAALVTLPGGGHLGFGSVVGDEVYLLPFASDEGD